MTTTAPRLSDATMARLSPAARAFAERAAQRAEDDAHMAAAAAAASLTTPLATLRAEAVAWLATAPEWVLSVHTTLVLSPTLSLPVTVDRNGVVRDQSSPC